MGFFDDDTNKVLVGFFTILVLTITLYSCSINDTAHAYYNNLVVPCAKKEVELLSKGDFPIMRFDNGHVVVYRNMLNDGYSITALEANTGEYCRVMFAQKGSINVPYFLQILSNININQKAEDVLE